MWLRNVTEKRLHCGWLLLVALPLRPVAGQAAAEGPYFYRALPYGSDAYMNPLAIVLNKTYAVSIIESADRRVLGNYGLKGVGDALAHPLAAIERGGGWWNFIRKELLPISYQREDMKWFTNYFGHLFEGGIYYRRLAEWYHAHGWPAPTLLAGLTSYGSSFLNEVYENRGNETGLAATVADLYVFDLAGIALFSSDAVARFFATRLHAGVWMGQASLALPSGEIVNNADHMFFKFPWGVIPNSSVFLWSGIGAQAGLTFHRPDGLDLSVGIGRDTEQRFVDPVTGEEDVDLAMSAGLFVDRHGSLLASLHVTEVGHRMVRLNVYPGMLGGVAQHLGFWAILNSDLELRLGISHAWLGAGLGFGR